MQGQAEMYLEKLNGVVEKDLNKYLGDAKEALEPSRPGPSDAASSEAISEARLREWAKFRETLIGLTDVTRSHFLKLVQVCPTA